MRPWRLLSIPVALFFFMRTTAVPSNYSNGEWTGIQISWNDARRVLTLRLARRSRMLPPGRRALLVKLGRPARSVVFEGRPVELKF